MILLKKNNNDDTGAVTYDPTERKIEGDLRRSEKRIEENGSWILTDYELVSFNDVETGSFIEIDKNVYEIMLSNRTDIGQHYYDLKKVAHGKRIN